MTYHQLALIHLATVLPAFAIGTFLLLRRKGTPLHRMLGRIYLCLMMVTGFVTLFMPASVGPQIIGHFGFIHLFSVIALYNAPAAWLAARRHDVKSHRIAMISLYVGGLLIAGGFALAPGRMLHQELIGPASDVAGQAGPAGAVTPVSAPAK